MSSLLRLKMVKPAQNTVKPTASKPGMTHHCGVESEYITWCIVSTNHVRGLAFTRFANQLPFPRPRTAGTGSG